MINKLTMNKPIILLAALCMATSSYANEKTMLILDASGSMWGQIDGRNKITIAKDAVSNLLNNWSDKEVGLMAYGHREKGSCDDIEILQPVAKLDKENIQQLVAGITPKGKTPLSAAVRQAAEALKYTEDKATVVLISDGIETCDLDPCKVGASLEKLGIDFITHVIGFDIKKEDQQGLRCLAENTGGQFIAANNAAELNTALDQVVKDDAEPLRVATIDAPENAEKGTRITITPKSDKPGFTGFINLYPANQTQHVISAQVDKDYKPVQMTLPLEVGSYTLKWESMTLAVLAERAIEVTEAAIQILSEDQAPRGSLLALSLKAPEVLQGYIRIYPQNSADYIRETLVGDNTRVEVQMPTEMGDYVMKWVNQNNTDEVYAEKAISVTDTMIALKVADSAKAGDILPIQFEAPANLEGYIYVYADGAFEYESENRVGIDGVVDGIEIILPEKAGTYLLRWQTLEGDIYAEKNIQVQD